MSAVVKVSIILDAKKRDLLTYVLGAVAWILNCQDKAVSDE